MNFTHLNTHSKASMLYGSADIREIVDRAKELKQPAIALTDYSNVFNAINFYKEATSAGVKPILGVDILFCEDAEQLKIQRVRQAYHLILLAENEQGWHNITRLISRAHDEDHFFYSPRIDFKLLEQYSEGVICLTGGSLDGVISYYLYDKTGDDGEVRDSAAIFKAEGLVRRFMKIFDADHFFLEVQNNGVPEQKDINGRLRTIAKKYGLRTVASNNVHYVLPSDAEAHKTLLEMTENKFSRATYSNFTPEEYYLKTREEMEVQDFSKEELDLTCEIANRCNVKIDVKKRRLPKYQFVPNGETSMSYLRKIATQGLSNLKLVGGNGVETYEERLERELKDIEDMGFADYFLIVHDVVSWVLKQGILIGRGRGSAGGSLVSYSLGITQIDPLKYGLIWERFLNKGRGGLPDIDTDLPRSRRQEVLEYVRERFGVKNVAQLVTLGGLQAKAVLKEVFRVYNMPFDEANKITALVPAKNDEHVPISLQEALDTVPELKAYYDMYIPWFKIALALEGCYKSTGIHASAVVISDVPFEESSYPLIRAKDGDLIFGWDMNTVDSLSLLKLDILGLTTLDDIQVTMELVKERRGIQLSRESMPLDDPATWAMLAQGFTIGIFQIEKQLGRTWSKNLQPMNIDELSDLISIIRPGPMECLSGDTRILVHTWVGKNGKKHYEYKTIEQLYDDYTKVRTKNYGRCAGGPPQLNICSINEQDHSIIRNKILKVVKSGVKDVYDLILTVDGTNTRAQRKDLHIKASLGHKFLTIPNDGIKPVWKELKNIQIGDYVCVVKKGNTNKKKNRHAQGWRNFRDIAAQNYKKECIFCDWNEASLDVNHLFGSRYTNNNPSNLCFMCPNHHREYTDGFSSVEDIVEAREECKLPNTNDLMYYRVWDINKVSREQTYDIAMSAPYHNFIAGDFVVHNSGMHTSYRSVKMKGEDAVYIHPSLEAIMGRTYSALLYQEQVIEICRQLAGMSLIDADNVRKAMGKKKPEEMKKWLEVFINGCTANNIDLLTAQEIWGYIEKFAGYGFNKSHGVGYALLAYETAYLKANYTTEFLCAKLRHAESHPDKFEQMSALVYDAKLFNIEVVPPRISVGNKDFAVVNDTHIAFGLSALKGVGKNAVSELSKIVKTNKTFDEILWAVVSGSTKISSAVMTALIRGGAFDDQEEHRVEAEARFKLLENMTTIELETIKTLGVHQDGKPDWIRIVRALSDEEKSIAIKEKYKVKIPNIRRRASLREALQEFDGRELFDTKAQRIAWEQFYLGISLSGSEADIYNARDKCVDLVKNSFPDMSFEIAVCIDLVRQITTKKGDPMAFLTARDNTYQMDNIVVFPRVFEQSKKLLEEGSVVKVRGKVDDRGSLIANTVERLR